MVTDRCKVEDVDSVRTLVQLLDRESMVELILELATSQEVQTLIAHAFDNVRQEPVRMYGKQIASF